LLKTINKELNTIIPKSRHSNHVGVKDTFISVSRNVRSKIDWIFKPVQLENSHNENGEGIWLYATWHAEQRPIAF